jgi:hypothetical protein
MPGVTEVHAVPPGALQIVAQKICPDNSLRMERRSGR